MATSQAALGRPEALSPGSLGGVERAGPEEPLRAHSVGGAIDLADGLTVRK